MKKIIFISLVFILLGFQAIANESKYIVKNHLEFSRNDKEQHCNLDSDPSKFKIYKRTNYDGAVTKNPINNADWYVVQTWGIRDKGSRMTNYKHGKSLGVCINKKGKGYSYTAVPTTAWGKKRSWTNITYVIGHRGYSISKYVSQINFPARISQIKKLQLIFDYSSKTEGLSNKNITLWIKNTIKKRPFVEVMLKFEDNSLAKGMRGKLPDIITDNYNFRVTTNKKYYEERKNEGLGFFFSVDAVMEGARVKKDGFRLDLNLRQVLDYLIDQKLISSNDILPGIDVTTEIWDGIAKVKINELKYDLVKDMFCLNLGQSDSKPEIYISSGKCLKGHEPISPKDYSDIKKMLETWK